ncbi:alpha/beta hydrolase [Terrabacter carboxydivorans]|uniref:Alpha/beta hydrolase n=1 Tax=Terrabacter carboxydivorans TaxID=619730 RepID=A0ABN3M1N7_9MICO
MATAPVHTVLVPGLLCSARLYEQLLPAVWSYGGVTIADNRRDSTMTAMAQRLLAAAPDRFVLAGLSMGGYVALEVLRLAPERVTGLALISTSARADSPEQVASRREQAQAVAVGRFGELVEAVYPLLVDAANIARTDLADFWRRMALDIGPDAFVAQLTAVMGRPDSRPDLASIRCPTAVVHGTGDRLIAPENAVEISRAISGAELTLVPDAGHMMAQEQPGALADAVVELLDAVTR